MPAPVAEPLRLPDGYGTPQATLEWEYVRDRLAQAARYWLVTVRPDGRPHAMPVDGLWLDDAAYFGGSPETVNFRNLEAEPRATLHLEDAARAIVVEGACESLVPDLDLAGRLADRSQEKYGWAPPAESYTRQRLWRLLPTRVLAWDRFPEDATRFVFPGR